MKLERPSVLAALLTGVSLLCLGRCSSNTDQNLGGGANSRGRANVVSVVASFYPLAFVVERVGGTAVHVTNLTPPGTEPHDFELSPDQVDELNAADVAIVLGKGFQPGVEKVAERRDRETVVALKAILGNDVPSNVDPHVWLDPSLLKGLVGATLNALTKADPSGAGTFAMNAQQLTTDLSALDGRFKAGLANCKRKVIVSSHDAFGRLASRYGLTTEGIAGFSPDAEPSPDRLAQLSDLVTKTGTTTIFTEELVSPAIAKTLARETGVTVEVLSPIEGAPEVGDYFTAMDANLEKLRKALEC